MVWFFRRHNTSRKRSLDELAANESELARLLSELGYDPRKAAQARRILTELKTSIRTRIPDFAAFQQRLRLAAQSIADESRSMDADRDFLEEVLRTSGDRDATLAILDRNPVGQRLPFVELVPVKRGSGTAWLAPVEEPTLVKRPVDPTRFSELLHEFAELFRDPDPAIQDEARVNLLDAIRRVGREASRESSYLLSAIQLLESRLAVYESSGQAPLCRTILDVLREIIDDVESARVQMPVSDASRRQLRKGVERYLSHPKLHSRWVTNYLIDNLLAPAQVESALGRSAQSRKTVEMIRCEVTGGNYCASEIIRRLRDMERSGLYFSSLVYELLGHQSARIALRSPKRHTNVETS